jgi:hypothetical protein
MTQANTELTQQALALFLRKRISEIEPRKSTAQIAGELGYSSRDVVLGFMSGSIKVPLDKLPALAAAIGCDPGYLFRLGIAQYWPGDARVLEAVFGRVVTRNEMELVSLWREAFPADPPIAGILQSRLRAALQQIRRDLPDARAKEAV